MALIKAITLSGTGFISSENVVIKTGHANITTPPLYIKVQSISGNKITVSATVTFSYQESKEQLMQKDYIFSANLNGGNFIAQAYEHLKTLPEFAGATDC